MNTHKYISISMYFLLIVFTALNLHSDKAFAAKFVDGINLKALYVCDAPPDHIEGGDCRLGGTSEIVTTLDFCVDLSGDPFDGFVCNTDPNIGELRCGQGFQLFTPEINQFACIKNGSLDDLNNKVYICTPEGSEEGTPGCRNHFEDFFHPENCVPNGDFIECETDDPDVQPVTCYAPDSNSVFFCVEGSIPRDNGNSNGNRTTIISQGDGANIGNSLSIESTSNSGGGVINNDNQLIFGVNP